MHDLSRRDDLALVGLVPALRASRFDVVTLLRHGSGTSILRVGRPLQLVVVAQVAVSFVLLVGSGLMLRSFGALQRLDPGFDAHGILTFQVIGNRLPTAEERRTIISDIQSRLEAIPGVQSVTASSPFPLADPFYPIRWGRIDALTDESQFRAADYAIVVPGYFETLKTRLVAGRTFTTQDNAPQHAVAVIDDALARKAFGEPRAAVGQRILVRIRTPQPEWVEVIGVVSHQRAASLTDEGREQVYFTDGFLGHGAVSRWAVRTAGDPLQSVDSIRATVTNVSGRLVVEELQPMDAWIDRSQARTRFGFVLISTLACIAGVLAIVGIYGVLSTIVRYRTPEVGARVACGAAPRRILTLILRQGLGLTGVGLTLGLAGAFVVTRSMTTLLVGVEPLDGPTFIVTAISYLVIAAAACLVPLVGLRTWIPLPPCAANRGFREPGFAAPPRRRGRLLCWLNRLLHRPPKGVLHRPA